MISFSGPIPLLLVAVVFSVALFFAYKDLSSLRAKIVELEKSISLKVDEAIADLSKRVKTQEFVPGNDTPAYAFFPGLAGDEFRGFAEEAARALSEERDVPDVSTESEIVAVKEEPVDEEMPPVEEIVPDVAVSAPKKRSKKTEV
jgi:hypothetical protein